MDFLFALSLFSHNMYFFVKELSEIFGSPLPFLLDMDYRFSLKTHTAVPDIHKNTSVCAFIWLNHMKFSFL